MLIYRARDKTSVGKETVPVQKNYNKKQKPQTNQNMYNINQLGNGISEVGLFWLTMLIVCPVVFSHCYITTRMTKDKKIK